MFARNRRNKVQRDQTRRFSKVLSRFVKATRKKLPKEDYFVEKGNAVITFRKKIVLYKYGVAVKTFRKKIIL